MKREPLNMTNLLTIKEASVWATELLKRDISPSNISYLIQYSRISKKELNGQTAVDREELKEYYLRRSGREEAWKKHLGDDINWSLSFDQLREKDTTKHVHRLHPYKGKFIPQLVEYFLDSHTDNFKKGTFFNKGDIVLDPFGGSGTTLVQSNELGMHAVGIDVSSFNCLISNVKVSHHELDFISSTINDITSKFKQYLIASNVWDFEKAFETELSTINKQHFPSPEFKFRVHQGNLVEGEYYPSHLANAVSIYYKLIKDFSIDLSVSNNGGFLDKWYLPPIKKEIYFLLREIEKINQPDVVNVLKVILSRTMRSCRATTHSDLATLKDPITEPYYCTKHYKICKPILSILRWWEYYSEDTIERLSNFNKLRTDTIQVCLEGDSRRVDIKEELRKTNATLYDLLNGQGFAGIFTSPPYVGLIDYHEQHAYAYDLFRIKRNDENEIGAMSRGQGKNAKESYVQDIADVLKNCSRYLRPQANIFVVANDKYTVYPRIADLADLSIINEFKRPVLNRTERDKNAYSETIFHMVRK